MQVLSIRQANTLYAKLSKCLYEQHQVEDIQHWPQPTSIKQLRAFLGLARYYRKFIKHFYGSNTTNEIVKES